MAIHSGSIPASIADCGRSNNAQSDYSAYNLNYAISLAPLIDSFGRVHTSLRISVTDRCNIRCFYCMPDENLRFKSRSELLTFEEMTRFASVAAQLGVTKLRLTGGEPLGASRDLRSSGRALASISGHSKDLAARPPTAFCSPNMPIAALKACWITAREYQPRCHARGDVPRHRPPRWSRSRFRWHRRRPTSRLRADSLERRGHSRPDRTGDRAPGPLCSSAAFGTAFH